MADIYVRPALTDYGSLVEITESLSFRGFEDGGSKLSDAHHSGPITP